MNAKPVKPILMLTALVSASPSCRALSSLAGTGGSQSAILKDDFSDSSSGWGTGTDADSSVAYVEGGLHMKIFKPNYFAWSNPDQRTFENIHMEVTAKNDRGTSAQGSGSCATSR